MGRRRARVGVLGGTFDHLHAGHRQLLATAFREADRVGIGLTTDAYLRSHPKAAGRRLQSYRTRRARLTLYLRQRYPARRWWLVPLENGVGGALAPEVELLVASEETRDGARQVNVERRRRRLRPAQLRFVPMVLADDLLPLNSTRIRRGTIDPEGRRRRPVRIAYPRRTPPALRDQVERAVGAIFPAGVRVEWAARPGAPPVGGSTSARVRAFAVRLLGDADWAIGILSPRSSDGRSRAVWVAIAGSADPSQAVGPASRYPRSVPAQLRAALGPHRRRWVGRRARRPSAR